jgi:hypothetical protein
MIKFKKRLNSLPGGLDNMSGLMNSALTLKFKLNITASMIKQFILFFLIF